MTDNIQKAWDIAYNAGLKAGTIYLGKIKREWYQKGFKEGKESAIKEVVEKAMWCQFCGDELSCFGCQAMPNRIMKENRKRLLKSLLKK